MNTWDKCKNCGGERSPHHYETDQCPVGGREAAIGQRQEWKRTTFEIDADETVTDLRAANEEMYKALRACVNSINYQSNPSAALLKAEEIAQAAISKHKG